MRNERSYAAPTSRVRRFDEFFSNLLEAPGQFFDKVLVYRRPDRAAKTSLCEPPVRQLDCMAAAVPHTGQAVGDGAALVISRVVSYWLTTRIRRRSKVHL